MAGEIGCSCQLKTGSIWEDASHRSACPFWDSPQSVIHPCARTTLRSAGLSRNLCLTEQMGLDFFHQAIPGLVTNDTLHRAALIEQQEGGRPHHLVLDDQVRVVIQFHL